MRPWLDSSEAEAAARTLASGWVAQGPQVRAFEQSLALRVGALDAIAVSSCTAALHLILAAMDLKNGDEIVVPSLSFIATANAPRYVGAVPVFADVDALTQNLTPATIEPVITERTRAVIVVHQVGMPADIESIQRMCEDRGILVVEDAACAMGSTYRGAEIGGHSVAVAFSFHPRKIITTGEGGMVATQDGSLAERIRRLRQHGMSVGAFERHEALQGVIEEFVELGYNYRMTDIQAAIGLAQLSKLDDVVARRRELAMRYQEALGDVETIVLPTDPPFGRTNYQSFVVTLGDDFPIGRDELLVGLREAGVSARRGVMAAHREPAFAGHAHKPLPVTESLADRTVILPMFHQMTEAELNRVVLAVRAAAGR